MRVLLGVLAAAVLAGCAGKVDYLRPTAFVAPGANVKVINRPRDAVWAASVPEISKQYYVINNMDRSSGLMNLSYSGDPERFIDCGQIISYVKNARGERTYNFKGEKAAVGYEIMNEQGLFSIDRRMSLEGRVNLVFEEIAANQTRVTVNTRYVVTRSQTVRAAGDGIPRSGTDVINFNSGGRAAFPPNARGEFSECAATGALERELLELVR